MKLRIICETCLDSLNELALQPDEWHDFVPVNDLQDSLLYEVTCKMGHVSRVVIMNPKFDLLFESGIAALKDGYYREAVSSFAVSLERFYEFSIRVFLKQLIDKIGQSHFDETWKIISKQSERQLGAFYALYLTTYNKPPMIFNGKFLAAYSVNLGIPGNDPTEFRNKVIHSGYVPNQNQALNYGEGVNFYIRTLMKDFQGTDGSSMVKLIRDDADSLARSQQGGIHKQEALYTFMRFYQPYHDVEGASLIKLARNGYNPHV
jgi:hypothetical protein